MIFFNPLFLQMLRMVADEVLLDEQLNKDEIPQALFGLKAVSSVMPYVRHFVDEFKATLALPEELQTLDLKGEGIDLLACKF